MKSIETQVYSQRKVILQVLKTWFLRKKIWISTKNPLPSPRDFYRLSEILIHKIPFIKHETRLSHSSWSNYSLFPQWLHKGKSDSQISSHTHTTYSTWRSYSTLTCSSDVVVQLSSSITNFQQIHRNQSTLSGESVYNYSKALIRSKRVGFNNQFAYQFKNI